MLGTAAAAHLSKFFVLAGLAVCPVQGKVNVDVKMTQVDTPYVTNLTSQQLTQQFANNLDTTMATDGKWMISGVTVTKANEGLRAAYSVKFAARNNGATHQTCLAISDVQYEITYAPVIYIASDYKDMGCRYGATVQHEKRHVDTDVRTITDYIPEMTNDIEDAAEKMGPQGPFADSELSTQEDRMIHQIETDIAPAWQKLLATRRVRQGQIDTLQNYLRDTALCPGQFPKFDGGQQ